MNNFFESPSFFVISAFSIGYILMQELDGFQQNAIGNWLQLVGQVIETSSTLLPNNAPNSTQPTFDKETLKKVRDAIDNYINK